MMLVSTTHCIACSKIGLIWTSLVSEMNVFPYLFSTLPESGTKALNIAQPRAPQAKVTVLDEHGKLVRPSDWHPALKSSCRNRWLLFPTAGWVTIILSLKRSRPEKNGTMYVRKILMKKESREVLAGDRSQCRCSRNEKRNV